MQTTIFQPVLALVALTAFVWLTMLVRRAACMRTAGIRPQDVPTRALADEKFGDTQIPNNNLMNLFELPVLFYVGCLLIYSVARVDTLYVELAWVYVVLRVAHSAVALTYNNVLHRGIPYLVSCCVLWLMWARIASQLLATD